MTTTIYKILTADQWAQLQEQGESSGAPIDISDGFVHFSTQSQVRETVDKHFKGQAGLFLIAMSTVALGDELKWEPSRGGDLFPHLYARLCMQAVQWAKPIECVNGEYLLPELDND